METSLAGARLLLAVLLAATACSGPRRGGAQSPALSARSDHAAGVQWAIPTRWQTEPARPMRVATYGIPAAAGDLESGECAAYFFGPGQGGSVEANLERWAGQFAQADGRPAAAQQETREISGLQIHTLSVSGTYLASAGPMSTVSQTKPNFALLGAIVEAPQGLVFFKLTGSAKNVEEAGQEFHALLDSLKREPRSR